MYIIIESHGGAEYATILIDENSNNMVFASLEEAKKKNVKIV